MKIAKVKEIVEQKINQANLIGWTVVYNNTVNTCGTCNYHYKVITISKKHCQVATDEEVFDTICHEVAHAVVGYDDNHSEIWFNECIKLGGTGNITSNQTIPYRYKGVCGKCSAVYKRHTAPQNKRVSCSKCDSDFNEKYIIEFEEYNQFELF